MDSRRTYRKLVITAGLLASLITILAGGFRGQLITINSQSAFNCVEKCSEKDCEHKKENHTYLSAPSEAIPASTANVVFDCPSCSDFKPEGEVPLEESPNVVVSLINNYFKTLVRSLIRTNAP